MKIMDGYSVIVDGKPSNVAIYEGRDGRMLRLRFPNNGQPYWGQIERDRVQAVAEAIAARLARGERYSNNFSFTGRGTLAELVAAFGYKAELRLRSDTLERVRHQLMRAGLRLVFNETTRDAPFRLERLAQESVLQPSPGKSEENAPAALPTRFWPQVLGLGEADELRFLRALTRSEPLLCLIDLPAQAGRYSWLQATWEGLLTWAYASAQRFVWKGDDSAAGTVVVVPDMTLQQYLKPGQLPTELSLQDSPRHMNLVTLGKGAEDRDFTRIKARWPGQVFRFTPDWLSGSETTVPEPLRHLVNLLCLVGGKPRGIPEENLRDISPLHLLVWARETGKQIEAGMSAGVAEFVASGRGERFERFRGSNEGGTALALKALTAAWIRRNNSSAALRFEERGDKVFDEDSGEKDARRVDLYAKGLGIFEIETMVGSGPIESFCARKVFGRAKDAQEKFHLVVPGEALLWAGPYLADIAKRLGERGRVMVPVAEDAGEETLFGLVALEGRQLDASSIEIEDPAVLGSGGATPKAEVERPMKLDDIAGYTSIRKLIKEEVIWVRQNPRFSRAGARASGILFYGPPGCGKSRLAQAICGELEQEVRLLAPSDLKGLYIGWGQIRIREHFDWLFEESNRVLLIDEFDAIARSRNSSQMHSDEKADVNELLVQLDKAGRLGRMVLCTTNYVSSLDEAVLRSGRFSEFVPVPPPDEEAAADIVDYYLARLGKDAEGKPLEKVSVQVPRKEDVSELVRREFSKRRPGEGWWCGADLEAAVDVAFRRKAREATSLAGPHEEVVISLSTDELARALANARRSIGSDSIKRFLDDLEARSPHHLYQEYFEKFGGE